jgi:hypothetical protein
MGASVRGRGCAARAMAGYPDNTFKPGNNATRAEAATVICNVLQ